MLEIAKLIYHHTLSYFATMCMFLRFCVDYNKKSTKENMKLTSKFSIGVVNRLSNCGKETLNQTDYIKTRLCTFNF